MYMCVVRRYIIALIIWSAVSELMDNQQVYEYNE